MPTQNSTITTDWQVTIDSDSDAISYEDSAVGDTAITGKYDYQGIAYIPQGDEILIAISTNIPPQGHVEDRPDNIQIADNLDNRTGNGVAFLNPNPSINLDESNPGLLAIRFGEHHNDPNIPLEYRQQVGVFKDFDLTSVTEQHTSFSNFDIQQYNDLIAARGGQIDYGESTIANPDYFGGENGPIFNEIENGTLIADSGFRYLTPEEQAEAKSQFEAQNINSDYVYGFAISKALVPVGESTFSFWAECGNDAIAADIINIGNPDIEVIKRVNGLDADTPAAAAVIAEGQEVVYTVDVLNTGNVDLIGNNISVVDPGTPLSLLPFTDVGNDNILSPGEEWSYVAAPTAPLLSTRRLLDFDLDATGAKIEAGDFIAEQYKAWGVTLSGLGNTSPANQLMAFDSENPTGGDEDLRTADQGRVLIISEDNDQADPDDDGKGGEFTFKWDNPVFVDRLGLLDLSNNLTVEAYVNDVLVSSTTIAGDGPETQQVEALNFSGPIDELRLSTVDSFAITSLGFNNIIENVVDVTVTDPSGLFQISDSDSAFYLNSAAEILEVQPMATTARPDLSGDGQPDLLWRNLNNGMNVLWGIDNFGLVQNTIHSTIEDTNWSIATYDDFDGDGNADLLLRHEGVGINLIRRLDADGTTVLGDIQLPDIPDLNWDFIDTADFNQDGNVDILLRHQTAGVNLIWHLDGAGGVTSATTLDPIEDTNWKIAASADFNQDGSADLLLRHQTAGINLIRQLDGFEILGDIQLPNRVDSNMHIEGARDFNGDGSPDIVWRNRSTGENSFWQLNGTQVVSEVQMTSVDNSWQLVV